jgi:hypothetical protein
MADDPTNVTVGRDQIYEEEVPFENTNNLNQIYLAR